MGTTWVVPISAGASPLTVYCCKTEDKEEQTISECVNVYETKPYTLDNYNDILKTRPPCMYGQYQYLD